MLVNAIDALDSDSGTVALTANTPAQLVGANVARNGLSVSVDPAATGAIVYVLLGAGTPSATNFHVALQAGGSWSGDVGGAVWRGAVQAVSTVNAKVGIAEV